MKKQLIIYTSVLFVLLSGSLLVSCQQTNPAPAQKQITIVFLFNDYSSRSFTDLEMKLINAFQKYNVPCTFGVIPYVHAGDVHDPAPQDVVPLTPMKASILKDAIEANVLEVALHGYSHQTILASPAGGYTEFYGLNYDSQKQKITDGKALLEEMLDTRVNTFIPPWQSYDLNTIQAIEELGFKNISAGMVGVTKDPCQLKFLPVTGTLFDLRDAVGAARKSREVQPIIVILIHENDFQEINRERGKLTFQYFIESLKWVTSQEYIRVATIEQATEAIADLDSHRFKIYSDFLSSPIVSISPPFLVPRLKYYPPSPTTVYEMKVRAWLFSMLFYAIVLVISATATFLVGRFLFSRTRMLGVAAKYGGLLLLGLFSVIVLRDLSISFKGATVLICLLGICLGIWASFHQVQGRSRLKQAR